MAMRWVVFAEFTDLREFDGKFHLSETEIREMFERLSKELPPSITLKIRGLTGPFAEYGKAAGAQ